ncbi:MAG: hypothetical protein ACLUHA_03100 [Bacteroides stercoris]
MVPKYNGTTGERGGMGCSCPLIRTLSPPVSCCRDARFVVPKSMEDMYYRLNDPEYRGDVLGFNMRGIALPITGKYLGAMFTTKKS